MAPKAAATSALNVLTRAAAVGNTKPEPAPPATNSLPELEPAA